MTSCMKALGKCGNAAHVVTLGANIFVRKLLLAWLCAVERLTTSEAVGRAN